MPVLRTLSELGLKYIRTLYPCISGVMVLTSTLAPFRLPARAGARTLAPVVFAALEFYAGEPSTISISRGRGLYPGTVALAQSLQADT